MFVSNTDFTREEQRQNRDGKGKRLSILVILSDYLIGLSGRARIHFCNGQIVLLWIRNLPMD